MKDIAERFWKALRSDMTVMLGLTGVEEGHSRPMTAQLEKEGTSGPIWFFGSKDTELVHSLGQRHRAVAHFASKGHDLFASIHGEIIADSDPAAIERLWNPFISAWYEGGKSDPKLQLLRFEPEQAQIWLNENSLFAGFKLLLGQDPKEAYRDNVVRVDLSRSAH